MDVFDMMQNDAWVLGMPLTAAVKQGLDREPPVFIREVSKDGEACVVTRDYREDRINVETRRGLIIVNKGRG